MGNKTGAKFKYEPEYCDKLIRYLEKGLTKQEIAAKFKVKTDTINAWLEKYEDFKDAWDIGFPLCFDWWMTTGKEKYLNGGEGGHGNDKGYKFWQLCMRQIFHFDIEDKKNSITNNIQIGNMQILQGKTDLELLEILNTKLTNLRLDAPQEVIEVQTLPENKSNP